MIAQQHLTIATRGRGTYDIIGDVEKAVRESGLVTGICHVFVHHTSASLILCENADSMVRRDLEAFMARLVPDGDPLFDHTQEGPDDISGPCTRHPHQDGPHPAGKRGALCPRDLAGNLSL